MAESLGILSGEPSRGMLKRSSVEKGRLRVNLCSVLMCDGGGCVLCQQDDRTGTSDG